MNRHDPRPSPAPSPRPGSPFRLDPSDPRWPSSLRPIQTAPDVLWARGRIELLERGPRVAIVGTRAPTPYGVAQAIRFAWALAEAGVTVVSGLARGIDSAAHGAALDARGATIAVLGGGVDRPWPAGPLADRMAAEGLLLSEYGPDEPPRRDQFPARNRIVSGLASVVLVIEAAEASGTLVTARLAREQGRILCALPGRVDHPFARGCHRLIREGAQLVQDPDEVLELVRSASAPKPSRFAFAAAIVESEREADARNRAAGEVLRRLGNGSST